MPFELGTRVGHYQILARLGAGSMGVVFRARDLLLERFVAVKVLPSSFSRDPDRLDRFVREAKILASLNHPNIGAIFGLEELPTGEKYLVLELVAGASLQERLKLGPLPIAEALRSCAAIAEALAAAHQSGVIHRDLKPANVMLTDRGKVKVLDFGLARQTRSLFGDGDALAGMEAPAIPADDATLALKPFPRSKSIEGTPGYMSPEQIRGEEQDQRTDIFAFGCVLYECLSGRRAFEGQDPIQTLLAPLSADPVWNRLPNQIPGEIRDLLARCLEKDASRRLDRIDSALLKLLEAVGMRETIAPRSAIRNNLPQEMSSFIGRERELAEARRILRNARLLTLTGIGGCGKTRLALRLARGVLEDHPDGVWFIDLAPVSDPERVPTVIASVLEVKEESSRTITEALTAVLSDRQTLLVIDNCEQVLAGVSPLVATLLASCKNLRVLSTSRQSLRLRGEHLIQLQPLTLPAATGEGAAAAVMSSEAGRLFIDRSSGVDATFKLDETNAAAVAEICTRLDGIPLALELAANRTRLLTVHQIRDRLDDRFRLLAADSSELLSRHSTLTAVIQWSYDQLTSDEQRFFRLFSVFSGGWTLSAATEMSRPPNDEFTVLDALTRLADLGLVVVDRASGREARYTMLETVKEYARGRLVESHEADGARAKHFVHFLSLAQQFDKQRLGPRKADWWRAMDLELPNLLSAHAWCDGAEDRAERGLRLVFVMRNYWLPRGFLQLGLQVSSEALHRPGAAAPTLARGKVLLTAGVLAYFTGRYDEAGRYLDQSLAILRELADAPTLSTTLTGLALIAMSQNQRAPARKYLDDAIQLARAARDRASLATALNTLGDLHRVEGRLTESIAAYKESMELNHAVGNIEDAAVVFCNLGCAYICSGDLVRARAALVDLLMLATTVGSKHVHVGVLDVATGYALTQRAWQLAARLYGSCDTLLEQAGIRRDITDDLFLEPLLAGARVALGDAAYKDAYELGRALDCERAVDEMQKWLAAHSEGGRA